MKTNHPATEGVGDMLTRLKREHTERGRLLSAMEQMLAEVRFGELCGSWIALEGSLSLLVRREGGGYGFLLCDNTHCYKSVVADLCGVVRGRRMTLGTDGGEVTLDGDGLLHLGRYGTFRTEESLLREEMRYEMDFALRAAEDGEEA